MTTEVLPILSLAHLSSQDGRKELAKAFRKAASTSGFMAIIDHPVPVNLIKDTFDASKRLFALPLAQKEKYERNVLTNRGYELIGRQSLYGQAGGGHEGIFSENHGITDLKEGWMVGPKTPSSGYLHGPNIFPPDDDCHGVADASTSYYDAVCSVASQFLKVVALSMDQDESFFDSYLDDPVTSVRLLHYPPQVNATLEEIQIGAGPHTDFGLTTWLAIPAGSPGLQVWHQDTWHQVAAPENSFIVNVGDLLSEISGPYKYRSSLHRVINASPVDRYSIPFFFEGSLNAKIKPIGSRQSEKDTRTVEGFLKHRYEYTYVAP